MIPHSSQPPIDPVVRPAIVSVHAVVARPDEARGGTAHFRPPALPNPNQFHSELPFTAHLGPRLRTRP
ncbi:MAG: hypothetical protein JNL39_00615 [Opitutaceae bacterium]|nr:hypothetical protein [Opitutaceae bacterium]